MVPTINSYVLFQQLPDARLILYPDSGHGALFQYVDDFVRDALQFLAREAQSGESLEDRNLATRTA
jgi:hypothetical protein